jgi:hypothetical protein
MKPVSTRMPSYTHPNNLLAFDTFDTDENLSLAPTPGLQLIMLTVCHQFPHPCPLVGLPLSAKLC